MADLAEQMDPVAEAAARFGSGNHCAQAVFAPQAARMGVPAETAEKIAAMFGGGVARTGQMCGACIGGLMALGLGLAKDGRDRPYAAAHEFLERFTAQHGSIQCRELLGHDLSTPEGQQGAKEAGVFQSVCPQVVAGAAGLVQELLSRE